MKGMRQLRFLLPVFVAVVTCVTAAQSPTPATAPAAAVSPAVTDALKLKVEKFRRESAEFQVLVLRIEKRRDELSAQGAELGDELRKALGAKDDEDVELDTFAIVKKPAAAPK
jgi:hypothetical protein